MPMPPRDEPFASDLVSLLRFRAARTPDARAYTFLLDGEAAEAHLTFAALDAKARAIAAMLQASGAAGRRALLLYAPGLDYVAGFFGCLYAGVVAVPVYPPDLARPQRTLPRLAAVAADAQATIALTTTPILSMAQALFGAVPALAGLDWTATDALDPALADAWRDPGVDADALAFLQYTSGSTASPRGVMLSHANLLHNLKLITKCFGMTAASQGVIWLPPYHDMGLIGGVLQPMHVGCHVVLMSPLDFLRKPLRWLQAISRWRGTTSGGPNFAYDLCVRKTTPEERAALDLSSWDLAFNGAEPVHPETLRRFSEAFAPAGFRPEAHYACYGLAEGTLIASGGRKLSPTVTRTVSASALREHRAAPAADASDARTLVGCGRALDDGRIVVVRPDTTAPCAPGEVGEILLAGPSVARGYWNRPEETARAFGATLPGDDARYLRTGDLGFLDDAGELVVVGRLKDLVIVRGRNHHPQDLERTAEACHPALRPGCGAAFAVDGDGEERLVVVYEVDRRALAGVAPADVTRAIRQAVAEQHEAPVWAVALIAAGSLPKTSSGKIQRHACKQEFLAGALEIVHRDDAAQAAPPAEKRPDPETLRRSIAAAPDPRAALLAHVRAEAARALRVSPADVDADASLYALGLDSLAAIELRASIEASFGVQLPIAGVLVDPSLARLADAIAARLDAPAPAPAAEADEPGEAPMSVGQQALWFLHQLAPQSSAYHVPVALRARGPLDVEALRRTFARLVARHGALRTTFAMSAAGPVQRVHAEMPLDFAVLDGDDETVAAEARRPFDLERGPLLRVRLFRRGPDEHVLLLALHHIVVDLWSLSVLAEELDVIYPAEVAGREPALDPPPPGYVAFARAQAEDAAGPRGAAALAWFRERLGGELPVLDLPLDRPRPPVQTYDGRVHVVSVDASLTASLRRRARERGTTLNVLLQAAFQTLLHRYGGQRDLVVGVVGAGRTREAHARLVGYCVNSLAIRTRPSPEDRFVDHLEATRAEVVGALEHQAYPFGTLVAQLQPARDESRSPVFQAMFVYQRSPRLDGRGLTALALDRPGAGATLGGLRFESAPTGHGAAQFEITLTMGEAEDGLVASFEYNTDLFAPATIARMAAHFGNLLRGIAEDPERRLVDLPLMDAAERAAVEAAARGERSPIPAEWLVPARFAAQAARTPDAPAVIFRDEHVSYRQLRDRAAEIALELRLRGVGARDVVGICLSRSPDMVAAVLGVLEAGAVYVPLDPAHPPERLALLAEDARARVVVTTSALRERWPGDVLAVDEAADGGQRAPLAALAPAPPIQAERLACLIFTSGSTGRPKAVMLEHGALANLVESFIRSYHAGPRDRMLPLTALASASFVGEILPPLCAGAAVVLPTDEEILDLEKLLGLIARRAVTIASTVPAVIAALNAEREPLAPLRLLLSGGEALAPGDVEHLLGQVEVVNGYGLTETTVCATYHPLRAADLAAGAWLPIGRPILNTAVYVLDAHLNPVPAGCAGEIFVGGDGIARGYFHQPALTAERFVPDPFRPGARMYRTGDLGRRRDDGTLEYLHRVDHQVKIRGHRVELGEVEAAVRRHPAVRDAFVMAREEAPGDRRLVAYVVATALDAADLTRSLGERLPSYMVPVVVPVEALPLAASGKVDVRALPAPASVRPAGAGFVPPRSELERRIAALWQEVLGHAGPVGTHDNFFDLGGDSLRLAQLHRRLRDELRSDLPLLDLFKHTTVGALAERLGRADADDGARARIQDEAGRRREALARRQQAARQRRGPAR